MRASYWLVAGILIAAVAVIAFWPVDFRQNPSPPGQYPLNSWRPQWTATPSIGRYRPVSSRDQDALTASGYRDAKMRSSDRKICTLPSVPLGPQLQLALSR